MREVAFQWAMQVRFATFNIRNSQADDGENSWRYRKEAVASAIKEIDPDVIGIQEALTDQMDFLRSHLDGYDFVGVGRIDGSNEGEFAPIFFRRSQLKLRGSGWFWISESPEVAGSKSWDTACERICTWAGLESAGREFKVFNTHLDHVSPLARSMGAKMILERVEDGPCIVTGDFNCQPQDEPVQLFLTNGFSDSGAGDSSDTFHGWRSTASRIDFIMGRNVELTGYRIVSDRFEGRDVSDHFPVVVEIRVPLNRETP
jgi:endonuclease/exonuclease/phosphatase family metal-dependent hydrolase